MKNIKKRLAYLRKQIENENISYEEIAELQSLVKHIDENDTLLLEWAGVKEFKCEHNHQKQFNDKVVCLDCGETLNNII